MTRLSAGRFLILLGTVPAGLANQANSSAQVEPKPQANADLLQSADRSAWKIREGQAAVEQVPSRCAGGDAESSNRVMLDEQVLASWQPEGASGLFGPKIELKSMNTSNWTVKHGNSAVAKAERILGIKPGLYPATAQLIAVLDDDTPFLSQFLLERAMWQVVIRDWTLTLPSGPSESRDPYVRTFDVLVRPEDGRVLKVKSRWPKEEPPMPPTVDSATAAMQMQSSGREKYHSFSEQAPKMSLLEAIAILEKAGWVPTRAKQIIGEYVVWSRMDREPRSVWAVTLRGVPVLKPPPGTPKDYQDQCRHIIDAETGEWLYTTNLPRLDLSAPEGKRRGATSASQAEGPDPGGG